MLCYKSPMNSVYILRQRRRNDYRVVAHEVLRVPVSCHLHHTSLFFDITLKQTDIVMSVKKKVLMICLGNICRSPMAEAVFADFIRRKKLHDLWEVDSAALIGYHTGKSPDHRAMATLLKHGITDYVHRARPIKSDDFDKFDWIFGMDEDNIKELERLRPVNSRAVIELLGKYDPEGELIIRDPYYDRDSVGFEEGYIQCVRSIAAFLEKHK